MPSCYFVANLREIGGRMRREQAKTSRSERPRRRHLDDGSFARLPPVKQQIIDVITKSKETNELWIKGCITQHGMNIALWKKVVDYFTIEIINFMIDIGHKFAVTNTVIKIQEGVLFVTACTTFEQQCAFIYIFFAMSPKYLKFTIQISSKYLQLYDNIFAIA